MAYHLDQIDREERADLDADPDEDEYAAPPRRWLRVAVAVVVMGLFAGGLWFAYTLGMRHTGGLGDSREVPLIRADARPMKIKPENPGGMQIPDRDMFIYGQQRPEIEHLLPPPEQPMARPAPPPSPVAVLNPTPTPAPNTSALPAPAMSAAANQPPAPAVAAASATAQPSPAATAGTPETESGEARSLVPVAVSPPKSVASRERPLSREAAAAAEILGISPRPIVARVGPARASAVRLQLGAMRSESEARGQWEQLRRKNPDLLGNLSAVASRADLGDKGTYYRIQTAPVTDPSTADRICSELRQRRLACVVVR